MSLAGWSKFATANLARSQAALVESASEELLQHIAEVDFVIPVTFPITIWARRNRAGWHRLGQDQWGQVKGALLHP